MKPDYKNWVPKGMVIGYFAGTAVALLLTVLFAIAGFTNGFIWSIVLFAVFAVLTLALLAVSIYMLI